MRQPGDGLAVAVLAGAVDRLDDAGLQVELLGQVGERSASQPLVLDLVVKGEKLRLGALRGHFLLELGGDLLERLGARRFDLVCLHQHDAEAALDRRADLALLERECGIGDRAIDHRALGQRAEIDVGILQAALGGERVERRAFGDLVGRGLGFLHVREHDLLKVAPLGGRVACLAVLIALLEIGIRNLDRGRDLSRRQRQHQDLAVFG